MTRLGNENVAQKDKNPRRQTKPKDINAPKRPKAAFFRFVDTIRAEVKQNNPQVGVGEIGKIFSSLWNQLPESRRAQFQEETNKEIEMWMIAKEEYKAQKSQEPVSFSSSQSTPNKSKKYKKQKIITYKNKEELGSYKSV